MLFCFSLAKLRQSSIGHVRLGLLLATAVWVAGCSSFGEDKSAKQSPQRIYEEAKEEMAAGGWDAAIKLLERLEGRAAGTILAQQAQLEKAYAQYRSRDLEQAKTTLERFMKEHPASPAMDYALYLKGLINFNDDLGLFGAIARQDLSERDQKASKDSFDAFKELVARFPDSKYSADASQRMTYIVNALAQYEVHVARYYFTRGAYVAAINRAQAAITDYPNLPATEAALYYQMASYEALGLKDLAGDTKRVLEKNYPKSAFLGKAGASDKAWWKLW